MNKKLIIPVITLSIASLASCGHDGGKDESIIVPDKPAVSTVATTEATTAKPAKTTKAVKTTKAAKTTKKTTAATTTAAVTTTTAANDLKMRTKDEISAEELHNVNIFLSNFAEQSWSEFDVLDTDNVSQKVYFCYINTKINTPDTFVKFVSQYDVSIPLDFMNERSKRFFGYGINDEIAKKYKDPVSDEHSYYKDGIFHFNSGDGESYTYMACAEGIEDFNGDLHLVEFTVYDMSDVCSEMVDAKYYDMTPKEVENSGGKPCKTGDAIIQDNEYNGKKTYTLVSYNANDYLNFRF